MKKMPSFNDHPTFYWTIVTLALAGIVYGGAKLHERRVHKRHLTELTARRDLQMADTWPSLPTIRPAYEFDHSDTSEAGLTYCPACALESVAAQNFRDGDGFYPMPRGTASFCLEHAVTWHMRAAEENA